jgi:hypothetical protein
LLSSQLPIPLASRFIHSLEKTEYQERFGLKSIILTIGNPQLTTIKLPASVMESPDFPFRTTSSNGQ